MAYFPNGTAGDLYQEHYCNRCIHDRESDCPIWSAHLLFNSGDDSDRRVLDFLIPMSEDGLDAGECRMFALDAEEARGARADEQYMLWRGDRDAR